MGTFASCTTLCSANVSGGGPPAQVFPAVAEKGISPEQKAQPSPPVLIAAPSQAPRRWVSSVGQAAPQEGRRRTPPGMLQDEGAGEGKPADYRRQCSAQSTGTVQSLRERASSAGVTILEDLDSQPLALATREWSEDHFGTILHKPSGVRVSPEKGIQVDGVDYRLSPADVEILEGTLGSGSGGVVRVGRLKASGIQVAIKTLKVGTDDEKREQMLKEIRGLVQAKDCPYLIQWYSGFADLAAGSVNVVVELMDGGSLADLRKRIKGRAVPAEHVACIAAQVLRGLHFLQCRELLHRDIKPENILHTHAGRVKLTDFGISKELDGLSNVSSTFVGTATYMAPERASGGTYSYESDVWSAGMVFYELAAGRYPFCTASFPELFEALCEGPEPRLNASPPALSDLVARCLTRDHRQRPNAEALVSEEVVAGFAQRHLKAFAAWLVVHQK